jgi:hypothetical protein
MKNKVVFLIFLTLIISCKARIVEVENLHKTKISFDELPMIIKDTLLELSKPKHYFEEKKDLLSINGNYVLEIKEVGPWIDYMLIIDIDRNIRYKLKRGPGKPYIIYDNNLFISDSYNMLVIKDIYKLNFIKYQLKNR